MHYFREKFINIRSTKQILQLHISPSVTPECAHLWLPVDLTAASGEGMFCHRHHKHELLPKSSLALCPPRVVPWWGLQLVTKIVSMIEIVDQQ